MQRLVAELKSRIERYVRDSVAATNDSKDLRIVFHGPPRFILDEVLAEFVEQGGIDTSSESQVNPATKVFLLVDHLPAGRLNPEGGKSGVCDVAHLVSVRNTPPSPMFVVLMPPGNQHNKSIESATSEYGLLASTNSGNATIDAWWRDPFIQELVEAALSRNSWSSDKERDGAKSMLRKAVEAANEADRHDVTRNFTWCALSRVLDINDPHESFGNLWSLACGFPPTADGSIHVEEQSGILEELASEVEDAGFGPVIARFKEEAEQETVREALNHCLAHLLRACDVPSAFERAAPFYYALSHAAQLPQPAEWWLALTVDRWSELLKEERVPDGSIEMECTNSVIPRMKGLPSVVADLIELRFSLPPDESTAFVGTLSRDSGAKAFSREWSIQIPDEPVLSDETPPNHKAPIRYTLAAPGFRKTVIKVVSLQTWAAGAFAFCRTARKIDPPRKARTTKDGIDYECAITLIGEGRHYIDLHVRPEITVAESAAGRVDNGYEATDTTAHVAIVSPRLYGLEVDASAECHYDLTLSEVGQPPKILRLLLTSDDTPAEGCSSEFERLIRLNRHSEGRRGGVDVQIDRQTRAADLQTWMLAEENIARSYYPLVLGTDYGVKWRSPEWRTDTDTIFSNGKFIHDPRPSITDMQAPSRFVSARAKIAAVVRGTDGNGLIEAAQLGVLSSAQANWVELVDEYVQSYTAWLEADPDVAVWADVAIVTSVEADQTTLSQDPDAIVISPLHALRIGWHCLAQRAMFLTQQKNPCPAASVLDPDSIPDALLLPLKTASGGIKRQVYFSVECSSDYWAVLWNSARLDKLKTTGQSAPFDKEFGVRLGGISSGFSAAQVQRSLSDISKMFSAKTVLNVLITSAPGQNSACNEGLITWSRDRFTGTDSNIRHRVGNHVLQIFDERAPDVRPDEAIISNLAEDTQNAVKWFREMPAGVKPDLGIIAQLDTSNATADSIDLRSPIGAGALIRHRVRRQLQGGSGAFLAESRQAAPRPSTGDALADHVANACVRLENLGDQRVGYLFAPNVHAIDTVLTNRSADYVAISSSSVDPACFLGGWLKEAYLWDYDLPSYSHRAGDTNGYYLLSAVKEIDRETLRTVLERLPSIQPASGELIESVMLEVARRGIPTLRGLAGGDVGASGDLGLLIAARLLQDEFRSEESPASILRVVSSSPAAQIVSIIIPVDPFRSYLDELGKAAGRASGHRPDLLVATFSLSDENVACRLTPIEVKYRGTSSLSAPESTDALAQATALSSLLLTLKARADNDQLSLWAVGFNHLLLSLIGYGFRVYSQQSAAASKAGEWSRIHQRAAEALLANEMDIQIDEIGRLIVIDAGGSSAPRDIDQDGINETIRISPPDAARIIRGDAQELFAGIRKVVGNWGLLPRGEVVTDAKTLDVVDAKRLEDVNESTKLPTSHAESDSEGVVASPELIDGSPAEVTPPGLVVDSTTTVQTTAETHPSVTSQGIEFRVGVTSGGFGEDVRNLNLSDTRLNQLNVGVVGDLGTGKTQFLKAFITNVANRAANNRDIRPRFLILDYKKDYSTDDFVKAVGARVIKPYHLPINIFDTSTATGSVAPWLGRFKFFTDILDKIYSGIGPVQRANLRQAVKTAYDDITPMRRQPTIYDVHDRYKQLLNGGADAPLGIIQDMVDSEIFSPDPDVGTISEFLDGVVVIALNEFGQDDKSKNMLVALMLNVFYEQMLLIPKRPYEGTQPQLRVVDSYLLVDEANNIMQYEFDVLKKLLLQGREFGVGVILASQYLRHFKTGGEDYREPLLTWFIHKVPNLTPQELVSLGITADAAPLAEAIKALPNHHCMFKSYNGAGEIIRADPFFELQADAGTGSE